MTSLSYTDTAFSSKFKSRLGTIYIRPTLRDLQAFTFKKERDFQVASFLTVEKRKTED